MHKEIKIFLTTILFFAIVSLFSKVNAASANISANKTTATVGDSVTITVKFTAAAWDLTVSGTGVSSAHYTDTTDDAKNKTTTKTLTLDTSSAGTKTINLTGTVSDGDTDVTSKINTSVKVTVNEKTNSGTNQSGNTGSSSGSTGGTTKASITKVVINGITVKKDLPVTNKDNVTVSVTTSNGEGLKIYNSLTKKTISASSGKEVTVPIMEGTNTLTITSNSGATATRKIYSQKEEETPGNFIEEPQEDIKVLLKSLSIKGVTSEEEEAIDFKLTPEFSSEIYEYSIIIPEEYNDITKLNIDALASQDDFTVEITGNENFIDGENIVTILVKSKDGEKSATYKIIVNKEAKATEAVAEPVEDVPQTISEEEDNSRTIIKIAIVVFTAIVAILGIIFAVVEYMYGKKHNGEEDFGKIPYSSIGFEKEETEKEDILEDLRKNDEDENELTEKKRAKEEDSNTTEKTEDAQEDEKPKRRGKHF